MQEPEAHDRRTTHFLLKMALKKEEELKEEKKEEEEKEEKVVKAKEKEKEDGKREARESGVEAVDESTGKTFFWNSHTRATSWDLSGSVEKGEEGN